MATISGDIDLMPVGDLVLWIAQRALTGTLTVKRRSSESRFVIRSGQLWQAASRDPREFLGQHLINFGYIGEDQLQRAFETQQETHVPLGRILVLVDAVKQEQLDRVLLFKMRESLLEALSWADGTFRLVDEDNSTRDIDTARPVDLLEVHSESLARAAMWREIRSIFPSDATRVDAVGDTARLGGFDRRLVDLMVAGRSVGEASLELHAMDFQTYARLYDLYNRGIVRPRLAAPVAAAPGGGAAVRAPSSRSGPSTLPGRTPTRASRLPPTLPTLPTPPTVPLANAERGPAPTRVGVTPALVPEGRADAQTPAAAAPRTGPSTSSALPRPERPVEAPGVWVPAEAQDPHTAIRIALAGRNWSEAFLLAQRILELDPVDVEAIAAWRVANAQLVKNRTSDGGVDLRVVPRLAMPREQVALAHLTSKERYVLSRIDGRRSLQHIAAVSPIHKSELVRIVNAFVSRGVLELKP